MGLLDIQVGESMADGDYVNHGRPRRNNQATPVVRASCPTCGDTELGLSDVQVQVCVSTGRSTYSFRCPACRFIISKHASDSAVEALLSVGAPIMAWTLPAEMDEPKRGPTICYDDLLEFHLALERGAWRAELAASG